MKTTLQKTFLDTRMLVAEHELNLARDRYEADMSRKNLMRLKRETGRVQMIQEIVDAVKDVNHMKDYIDEHS
jgi:hypothetical protein